MQHPARLELTRCMLKNIYRRWRCVLWLGVLVPGHRRLPSGSRANLFCYVTSWIVAVYDRNVALLGQGHSLAMFRTVPVVVMIPAQYQPMRCEYHEDALNDCIVWFSGGLAERPGVDTDTVASMGILAEVEHEAFARAADKDAILFDFAFDEVEVALLGQNFFVELFLDRLDLVEHILGEGGHSVKLLLVRCPVVSVTHD